jgi:hypothetical protein
MQDPKLNFIGAKLSHCKPPSMSEREKFRFAPLLVEVRLRKFLETLELRNWKRHLGAN